MIILCQCNGRQCIGYIVTADDMEIDGSLSGSVVDQVKVSITVLVKGNIIGKIITVTCETKCDHLTCQTFRDLGQIRNLAINNKSPMFRDKLGKTTEGMADVVDILKEIQMIRINIQNNSGCWVELQETVGVFAGLSNKILGMAYADISVNHLQNAANGDGWVLLRFQKDMGYHGGSRCLAMCAGNCNGILVIFHYLSYHFGTFHHWKSQFFCCFKFGIVRMDGCRIYNKVDIPGNIFFGLAIYYMDTK